MGWILTDLVYTFEVGARVLSLCEHISLRQTHPSKLANAKSGKFHGVTHSRAGQIGPNGFHQDQRSSTSSGGFEFSKGKTQVQEFKVVKKEEIIKTQIQWGSYESTKIKGEERKREGQMILFPQGMASRKITYEENHRHHGAADGEEQYSIS